MDKNHALPTRRSPRIPGYDYSQAGAYLVTISIDDRTDRLGRIEGFEMHQNRAGALVESAWKRVPERFASVELDAYIVMPNHFHGIVFLGTDPALEPPSLSAIIQASNQRQRSNTVEASRQGCIHDITGRFGIGVFTIALSGMNEFGNSRGNTWPTTQESGRRLTLNSGATGGDTHRSAAAAVHGEAQCVKCTP